LKVGDLATAAVVSVRPERSLRQAAEVMMEHRTGSAVVLDGPALVGILSERDLLRAIATQMDLDETTVEQLMTRDVQTIGPDWEVYEATAEMAARHVRHLVVCENGQVLGVLSVRDVLLAGQRVQLTGGNWAVLRDPLTLTIRERRRLQRYLLILRGSNPAEFELASLTGLLVGSWSFDVALPAESASLNAIPAADYEELRAAVLAELPDLQRSVHPSPGWRRR
jgi:CBS domain-containing protein